MTSSPRLSASHAGSASAPRRRRRCSTATGRSAPCARQHGRAAPVLGEQLALLETFASQAVIAIENARLFQELEQRNADLQASNRQVTEALEQQTASARSGSSPSSPTDAERVLDAIVERAVRLMHADGAMILRL